MNIKTINSKRKIPNNSIIYAGIANNYLSSPKIGDRYIFSNMKYIIADVKNNVVTYYKNGKRYKIEKDEFEHMINSINGNFQFECYSNDNDATFKKCGYVDSY